jgi:hypothetical protein
MYIYQTQCLQITPLLNELTKKRNCRGQEAFSIVCNILIKSWISFGTRTLTYNIGSKHENKMKIQ